jgi:hypothetical protein
LLFKNLEEIIKFIFKTKGELNAEKKEKYEQAYNTFKKLSENTEILADLLGEKIPDLPIDGKKN